MRMMLSTNVKDENNLEEWLEYHRAVGFDHIMVLDDESREPVRAKGDWMTVIRVHAKKKEYMEKAIEVAMMREMDYLLHLDGDEYLYLGFDEEEETNRPLRIHEWMSRVDPENKLMAIYFNWLLFGSAGHDRMDREDRGCLRLFQKCSRMTNMHIKTMARVSDIASVENPHLYRFHREQTIENTRSASRPDLPLTQFGIRHPNLRTIPSRSTICIAHYHLQSWDRFRERRQRPRDDIDRPWLLRGISLDSSTAPPMFHIDSNDKEFPWILEYFEALMSLDQRRD